MGAERQKNLDKARESGYNSMYSSFKQEEEIIHEQNRANRSNR